MSQGLRPSQYITTFGPGAIIETPTGPHVLCNIDEVLKRVHENNIDMDDLAIRDIRLQRGLLGDAKIFKIPDSSNWSRFTYPTKGFPTWNLCVQHSLFNVIHEAREGCPECKGADREKSKHSKFAIRFLVACPNGHMDDVNWRMLIHRRGEQEQRQCANRHFHWIGAGASLSAIKIKCPGCGIQKELGEIYSYKLKCRGRRPERPRNFDNPDIDLEDCDTEQAIVVQRGSFQLRLPEVITSLTIPPLVGAIHRTLQQKEVLALVQNLRDDLGVFNEESFRRSVRGKAARGDLPQKVAEQLDQTPWNEIQEGFESIERSAVPRTTAQYLEQEHQSLMNVVETGFPPYPQENERRKGEPVSFKVDAGAIRRKVAGPNGMTFRVMPIERLRVVMVQKGYRRVVYTGSDSKLSSNRGVYPGNPADFWYPGVEQFGEGVYVDLNPSVSGQDRWYPSGDEATRWDDAVRFSPVNESLIHWNALSVWWHSLSHRLINAMSLHSGYSSTAIRERVYMSRMESGEWRGGVLLYTTQPGGDGTMGGLTSLVPSFKSIFEMAFNGIDRCSNDPLCEKAEIDAVSNLGAACYSCLMVSETSCEHYNGFLHRGLLLGNLP